VDAVIVDPLLRHDGIVVGLLIGIDNIVLLSVLFLLLI
jgi:hypothetical protein